MNECSVLTSSFNVLFPFRCAPLLLRCWIKGSFPSFRFGFYYGPMAFIWLANVILYILIIRKAAVTTSTAFKTVVVRLSLYILAAVLANFPALVNRIQNLIDPNRPIFVLFVLHALCNPLQGFVNAIVYSLSKPLRKAYKALFKRMCCGRRSQCCCKCLRRKKSYLDAGGRRISDDDEEDEHEEEDDRTSTRGRRRGRYDDDAPSITSEYDEEEEAYRHYQRTITLPRPSSVSGYTTNPATVGGFETQPLLLSGSYPNIQSTLFQGGGGGGGGGAAAGGASQEPQSNHHHHQQQQGNHLHGQHNATAIPPRLNSINNYGSGSGFSTSDQHWSDYPSSPPDSEYLDP